jgi:hypothetical protein
MFQRAFASNYTALDLLATAAAGTAAASPAAAAGA